MKLKILLFALLLPVTAWGQGVRFDSSVLTSATNVPIGAQAQVYTYPNSVVTVCAYPASSTTATCTNTVLIYSNVTLTTQASNPITTDNQGKFGFWLASGNYSYSITSPTGKFLGSYIFSLGGSGGSGSVISVSGVNANGLTWTITNPTSTPALTVGPDNTHCIPTNTGATGTFLSANCTYQTPPGGLSSFQGRTTSAAVLTTADVTGLGTLTNNTTGNAATASAFNHTPTLCGAGFAPTGVTAAGNATGCAAIGGANGFPITLGTTPINAGSSTSGLNGMAINGVTLDATGAATAYLDRTGNYSVPTGSGGISLTTTGLSGAATLVSSVLNIPRYDTAIGGIPFCTGYTPTNGQFIELTTGSSPNPCYTAVTGGGSGNTTSTALSTNRLPKANGANSIIDSSITDNGAVSTTEAFSAPAVNTVINAGSSLSAAITSCGSANTTIQITQTIAVGSGITVPANCTLWRQSAGLLTGTSITINGQIIDDGNRQMFGAGLAVTFGPQVTSDTVEMFGGKADGTGVTGVGTDNCTPYTAAYNALSGGDIRLGALGMYRTSCAFAISKPNISLRGVTRGVSVSGASTTPISTILIDSASVAGVSTSGSAIWNDFSDLQVIRVATTPGSTSKSFDIETGGSSGHDLVAQDSVWPFYFKGAGGLGQGSWTDLYAGWGFTGFAGAPAVAACGYMLDTTGPIEENDLNLFTPWVAPVNDGFMTSGVTGLCLSGPNVSDVWVHKLKTARVTHSADIEATGTTNGSLQNLHFIDGTYISDADAFIVNGLAATADIAPRLTIQGGWVNAGSGNGFNISNSSNISILGLKFLQGTTGSASHADILLNTVDGFIVNGNFFGGQSLVNISCNTCSHGSITGNDMKTANTATGATGIKVVSGTNIAIQGNSLAGNGGTNLLNGITFDAASSNNGPWSLNTIDTATVTTPVTDAGTNNNAPALSAVNMSVFGSAVKGVAPASGGGTTNYLRADGTWAAPPGGGGYTPPTGTGFPHITSGAQDPAAVGETGTGNVVRATSPTLVTPILGTPASGVITNLTGTCASCSVGGSAASSTTATNLSGGALGSAPYQSAANTTAFIASPTTSGHTFFYGWQPSGSAIAPTAIDGATYLASPPAIGGTAPAAVKGTIVSGTTELYALALGTANSGANFGSAGYLADGSYWDGSAPQVDRWVWQGVLGTGTNPKGSLYFAHTGSPGSSAVYMDSLVAPALNQCPDTSGSGTAQSCNTAGLQTLGVFVPNMCIVYTTTTTNSGTGLTLNLDGLGAKSIAIPGASGWTTTLTAGIIPANKPLNLCYDGTNWNVQQTGVEVTAAGAVTFTNKSISGSQINSGTVPAAQIPAALSSTTSVNGTSIPSSSTLALHIANGTAALGTSAIASGACATTVTTTATGTATTDPVGWGFNGNPTAVTGYAPTTNGMLTIIAWPTSGNVNFAVCNNTSASITPGAITLNWSIIR